MKTDEYKAVVGKVVELLPRAAEVVALGNHEVSLVASQLTNDPEVRRRLTGSLHSIIGSRMSFLRTDSAGGWGTEGSSRVEIR